MAELEKMGTKYRVALRVSTHTSARSLACSLALLFSRVRTIYMLYQAAKDARFERLPCTHKGTYADDCLVERVQQHKCYIVGTCDKDLKRRLRKIPGVPIMYIKQHKFSIERLPEATIGGGEFRASGSIAEGSGHPTDKMTLFFFSPFWLSVCVFMCVCVCARARLE